jgi:pimeloyl-ACP methyl ester carboxylesterase
MGLFQVPRLAEKLLAPGGRFWREMLRGVPVDQEQRYARNAAQPGALSAMLNWYRALPLDIARPSVRGTRIKVPTLYIWGNDDPALGEYAARGSLDFVSADFRFVALMNHGHWLPERAAHLVIPELIEQLTANP